MCINAIHYRKFITVYTNLHMWEVGVLNLAYSDGPFPSVCVNLWLSYLDVLQVLQ